VINVEGAGWRSAVSRKWWLSLTNESLLETPSIKGEALTDLNFSLGGDPAEDELLLSSALDSSFPLVFPIFTILSAFLVSKIKLKFSCSR
jgi:hypothetical protein